MNTLKYKLTLKHHTFASINIGTVFHQIMRYDVKPNILTKKYYLEKIQICLF